MPLPLILLSGEFNLLHHEQPPCPLHATTSCVSLLLWSHSVLSAVPCLLRSAACLHVPRQFAHCVARPSVAVEPGDEGKGFKECMLLRSLSLWRARACAPPLEPTLATPQTPGITRQTCAGFAGFALTSVEWVPTPRDERCHPRHQCYPLALVPSQHPWHSSGWSPSLLSLPFCFLHLTQLPGGRGLAADARADCETAQCFEASAAYSRSPGLSLHLEK